MRQQRSERRERGVAINVIGGLAGGLLAAYAMERFQRALGNLSPDLGGVPGAGGQQYRQPQSEPATHAAADTIARATTGRDVPPSDKPAASAAIHYAFGGTVGAIYGAAVARNPEIASGGGAPFGAAMWLIADELAMPALGLARRPSAYPLRDHATTFLSHLLYGTTTEMVRRSVAASLRW